MGQQLFSLMFVFFLKSLQTIIGIVLELGYDLFLPNPFQLIICHVI
jgi:hypothetical protein